MPKICAGAARGYGVRLAAMFAAVLSLIAVPVPAQDSAVPQTPVASVTVADVVMADMVGRVPIAGTLVPREEVLIYPQVNGSTIDTLTVDVGDRVKAGDVLATLNNRTLTAQLAQARAEFARAEAAVRQANSQITSVTATATRTSATLRRSQRLREAGTITEADLDQALADSQTADAAVASASDGLAVAQAQLQQAQAQLDIAEQNLEWTTLRSPVDGLISARNGQIGAIAASGGEPIFRVITDGTVEVEAEVIETALGGISVGDTAKLSIAGLGEVSGTVRRIAPTVDPVTRLGIIRIEVDAQEGLRAGVFASGWIITVERTAPAVPSSAVLTDSDGTFVLVVKDGILDKRAVVAGLIWNDLREIVQGVEPGEVVVAKAGSFFGDGDRINPVRPGATVAAEASR